MFLGGVLVRLKMLLTSALTVCLVSLFSQKIASSTEAKISAVGILLGAIAKLRPCSSPFLSSSVNSLKKQVDKNSIEPSIQFTAECETDGKLPFLDTCVQRTTDGKLETVVYRKPIHTDKYLSFNSHHPRSHKKAVVTTLFQTAENLTSNNDAREPVSPVCGTSQERVLNNCGIKVALRPFQTLGHIFAKLKDRVPTDQKTHAVYSIPCGDCEKVYLGQTKRQFCTRLKEHQRAVSNFNSSKSALAEHVCETSHNIAWEDSTIITTNNRYGHRLCLEAWHINASPCALNRDDGSHLPQEYLHLVGK